MTNPFGEPFTPEWRLAHAQRGDSILARFEAKGSIPALEMAAVAAVAAAHYAAANVRAKPVPAAVEREAGPQ